MGFLADWCESIAIATYSDIQLACDGTYIWTQTILHLLLHMKHILTNWNQAPSLHFKTQGDIFHTKNLKLLFWIYSSWVIALDKFANRFFLCCTVVEDYHILWDILLNLHHGHNIDKMVESLLFLKHCVPVHHTNQTIQIIPV